MRSALPRSFLAYARASASVRRWLDRGDRLAGAFLSRVLTPAEKSELGVRIYDASPAHRGLEMLPWEVEWLGRRLPPAPARLLVGACGAGRELVWLAAAGYRLDAFDPAANMTRMASARLGERARVHTFRYEDLSAAVLDGRAGPASALVSGGYDDRYDAVLLGWGSLTHVLDEAERLRLVRALHRLCARGPILASFLCDHPIPSVDGRADRLGVAAGRTVARLRKLYTEPSPREMFTIHAGFVYRFTREEIAALAATVGRTVLWDQDDTEYPHATFVTP